MPSIKAFAPLRYNPSEIPDLGAVIAPPYDVISDDRRRQLLERDPHNIIRLILPEGTDDARYAGAAALLDEWQRSGVLVRESGESLYLYTQAFDHPVTGERITRHGFLARVRLSPFSDGEILPHERTLSGPKADRLKLMQATNANLEPIFGVYRDPSNVSARRLEELTQQPPLIDATDADGVQHRVWRVTGADAEAFAQDLRSSTIFIVDGHHRYETALNYRGQSNGADRPVDSIMMFLAPMGDPGLVILPTHRVVHSLASFDFDALLERLGEHFTITDVTSDDAGLAMLDEHRSTPSYLLVAGPRMAVVSLKPGTEPSSIVDASLPESVQELDVTILHEHILEHILGISKEAQASQTNLRYVKSAEDAFAEARRPDVQLVALMNATRLEQVERVAQSGHVMPQKSTYFYPKLASGLLINPLWE
ncbi:MAG TPA: DUF1015 domain-containing protein [Candidatus Kapabacteria bacterium]|nr:DUF1015 domain-containing protein [Candidatus Kapabacteria bacterium]